MAHSVTRTRNSLKRLVKLSAFVKAKNNLLGHLRHYLEIDGFGKKYYQFPGNTIEASFRLKKHILTSPISRFVFK